MLFFNTRFKYCCTCSVSLPLEWGPSSRVVEDAVDSKQQVSRVKLALSSSGFLQAAISQQRLLVIPRLPLTSVVQYE